MQKIVFYLVSTLLLLFLQKIAFADSQIVINEIMADPQSGQKEWVEIYVGDSQDISSYYLKDKVGTKKTLENLEQCGNYYVWELPDADGEGWLNNSGEESLFLYDSQGNIIDSHEGWTSPGEAETLARVPNATGDFEKQDQPTRCASNPDVVNESSPTPEPSSSTSTQTAKSPTPKPKSSPKSSPQKSPSPQPTSSPQVLGQTAPTPTPGILPDYLRSPEVAPGYTEPLEGRTKVAAILVGAGSILIGLSIVFYLWYKKYLERSARDQDFKM